MNTKEILDKVCSSYTKYTRAYTEEEGCVYLTEDGRKCALGMFMTDPGSVHNESAASLSCDEGGLDRYLLPEVHGHPTKFWAELKALHDTDRFWCAEGLTEEGEEYARHIANTY